MLHAAHRILLACCLMVPMVASAQTRVARIINGQPTTDFAAVGIVGSTKSSGFCTGTLLSDRHVLTAAHCAQFIDGNTAGTFTIGGKTYSTVKIDIHSGFDPVSFENDIAILELSESVPDIEPMEIFRGTPLVGDALTIVGFGSGGTATGGADGTFGTKQVGVTFIDAVDDLFIYWDYDDASQSNTAPGDSGGPGFIEVADQLYIACITSGGTKSDASLGDLAFNTRIDTFAAWIDAIVMVDDSTNDGVDDGTDDGVDDGSDDGVDDGSDDGIDDSTDDSVDDGTDDGTDNGTDDGSDDGSSDDVTTNNHHCHHAPVRQGLRKVVAQIFSFLSNDSFISFLQDLAAELRGETAEG